MIACDTISRMWWCDIPRAGIWSKDLSVDIVLGWNQDCPLLAQPQFNYSQVATIQWLKKSGASSPSSPNIGWTCSTTAPQPACRQINMDTNRSTCTLPCSARTTDSIEEPIWQTAETANPEMYRNLSRKSTQFYGSPTELDFFRTKKKASLLIQWPHRNVQEL